MKENTKILAVVATAGALALAACGGSSDISPVASTAAVATSDGGTVTASGNGPGPGPGDGLCGAACTGPLGPDPEYVPALLVEALQEEYRAEFLYRSVLEDFPGAMPFAVIAESEARHVEALRMLFTRREMTPPPSEWTTARFDAFTSLAAACAAGVQAETEDAAFYAPHLQREDLPQDVRNVFTNLQAASLQNHLPAFEACR
jgi:hypothetical protein